MAQLRQDYRKFVELQAEVIAIGPEDRESLADYWHREQLPFIGIPDPKHDIANLYSQEVKLLKFGRMPALIVVDKEGIIRYSHYAGSTSNIPPNDKIISLLDDINQG
jgi:peroxiredoxin